ncbi:MAG: hypothetical protein AB7I38_01735 [Dehalococcoidia bacterium]
MDEQSEARRPRSTVKVLGSLLLAVVVGLAAVVGCLSLVVSSTPSHTLEVPQGELTVGAPRFYAQPSFGADASGRTFGVWLLVPEVGSTRALLAEDPASGCYVNWRGELAVEGQTGVFVDTCDGTSYGRDGTVLSGTAPRGLDSFDVDVTATAFVVDLERVLLGRCRDGGNAGGCSPPGQPRYQAR